MPFDRFRRSLVRHTKLSVEGKDIPDDRDWYSRHPLSDSDHRGYYCLKKRSTLWKRERRETWAQTLIYRRVDGGHAFDALDPGLYGDRYVSSISLPSTEQRKLETFYHPVVQLRIILLCPLRAGVEDATLSGNSVWGL